MSASSTRPLASSADATAPEPPSRALRPRWGLIAAVAALVVALDQLTKTWARRALADGPIDLVRTLQPAPDVQLRHRVLDRRGPRRAHRLARPRRGRRRCCARVAPLAAARCRRSALGLVARRRPRQPRSTGCSAPATTASSAGTSSTSSTCSGGRCSTSPTSPSCVGAVLLRRPSASRQTRDVEEVVPAALAGERLDRFVALLTGRSRADAAALVAERRGARSAATVVTAGKAPRRPRATWSTVDAGAEPGPVVVPDPSVPVAVVHEDDDVRRGRQAGRPRRAPRRRPPHRHARARPGRPLPRDRRRRRARPARHRPPPRPGHVRAAGRGPHRGGPRAASSRPWPHARSSRVYLALVHGLPGGRRRPGRRAGRPVGPAADPDDGAEPGPGGPHPLRGASGAGPSRACSLLRCRLETGRTHQIRVHLAAIGHPVVGDDTYAGGRRPACAVPRLFLHATRLAFDHPVDRRPRWRSTPRLPADLARRPARLSWREACVAAAVAVRRRSVRLRGRATAARRGPCRARRRG